MSRRPTARNIFSWRDIGKTRYGLRPLVIFCALTLFSGLGQGFSLIAGPNIAQDLNLDIRQIAGILSVVGTIGLGATLLVGWLSDRRSRITLLTAGLIVEGASGIAVSAAGGASGFTMASVTASLGGLAEEVAKRPLLADYYPPDQRGRVFGIMGSITEVTRYISLVLVGLLVAAIGWRLSNVILTAPVLLIAITIPFLLKEPARGYFEKKSMGFDEATADREDQPLSFGEGWRTTWSVRLLRRFFVSQIFGTLAFGVVGFIPFELADVYGLNAAQRGFSAIPNFIALGIGGFVGGSLLDALSKRSPSSTLRFFGALSMGPALAFIVFAIQPPLLVFLAANVFMSFVLGAFVPSYQAILSQVIPARARGQGLVVISLAELPGKIALGLLIGPVVATYGFRGGWLMCIPLVVITGILMISVADFYEGDRRNAILGTATEEEARRAAAEGGTKILLVRGVNVFYEQNQVLFGVDLEVEQGEIVALLGTNGAGKSTLLRAISGSQEASDGVIYLDGRDITHMPPHEIAERGVVHMPGGRGVFPGLSVEENLKLATWLGGAGSEAELLAEAYELFPVLKERRSQHAGLLSGGEQQMLSLAQAFMAKPKLLMIDELSLGLSPAIVGELIEQVREINRRGTTVIVVEQSVNVALTIAKRAVFMEKGEVRFVGKTEELLRRPDILRAVYVKGTTARAPVRSYAEPTEARVVLDVAGITKHFGGVTALEDVNLTLNDHQILGLIGPNGSGKTTLFDIISGYQTADAGTVTFEGVDITSMSASDRARRGLVRRFQDARLFPSLTVMESLLVAFDQSLEQHNLASASISLPAMRRSERRARAKAEALIELLDLGAYRDKFVKELSTGVRRIVDIAWILATEPKVLLLDEPSSGVAQAEAESFVPLLRRVRRETACAILLVEHDISLVSALADELIAMASGVVIARGSANEVLEDDHVIEAFLGTSEAAVRRSGAIR